MRRKLRIWNACRRLTSVLNRVHVSAQYKSTDRMHDSYRRSSVTRLRLLYLDRADSWPMPKRDTVHDLGCAVSIGGESGDLAAKINELIYRVYCIDSDRIAGHAPPWPTFWILVFAHETWRPRWPAFSSNLCKRAVINVLSEGSNAPSSA